MATTSYLVVTAAASAGSGNEILNVDGLLEQRFDTTAVVSWNGFDNFEENFTALAPISNTSALHVGRHFPDKTPEDIVLAAAIAVTRCTNVTATTISGSLSSTYIAYRVAVDVYLVGALCLAGLLGNALSIAVLYRDRRDDDKRNTTNWLLQALAIVDTLYLASCVAIQPLKTIYDMTDWFSGTRSVFRRSYPYVEPQAWAVASIAQTSTVWLVLLVTVDRYLAVCHPWLTEWRTKRRAKIAVVVLLIIAVIYNIPRFFERQLSYERICGTEEFTVRSQKTAFRENFIYFVVYKTICYFCFRSVGPLIALVALNIRLVRALQIVRRRRRDMAARRPAVCGTAIALSGAAGRAAKRNRGGRRREGLTLMLVTVVTVFVVCELPDLGVRVAFTMYEAKWIRLDLERLRYVNAVSNALLTVNSSVNFLIYCLVGKKFRRVLYRMCCSRRWRRQERAAAAAAQAACAGTTAVAAAAAAPTGLEHDAASCLSAAAGTTTVGPTTMAHPTGSRWLPVPTGDVSDTEMMTCMRIVSSENSLLGHQQHGLQHTTAIGMTSVNGSNETETLSFANGVEYRGNGGRDRGGGVSPPMFFSMRLSGGKAKQRRSTSSVR